MRVPWDRSCQSLPWATHCGSLEIGLNPYYKIANDLIDNGNFGQALVLSKSEDPQGDFRSGRWFGA